MLTTPAAVRDRIHATPADISDEVLNRFIEDCQAYIETVSKRTFSDSDTLARSICTDLAAARALVYIYIPSMIEHSLDDFRIERTDPLASKFEVAQSLWTRAVDQLALLIPPRPRLLPRSSTSKVV